MNTYCRKEGAGEEAEETDGHRGGDDVGNPIMQISKTLPGKA